MTFTVRIRSNPGSEITADYECPVHGLFTATVRRSPDGDPPRRVPCTSTVEIEHHCPDPPCGDCGFNLWQCLEVGDWRPSAPGAVHVRRGELVRGKSAERPPDRHVMDTRPLADGMSVEEFKARRAAVHRDESLRRVRSALGRGRKVWT